jgi:hypothetical protein
MKESLRTFNGSPFGGNTPLPNPFGAQPGATEQEIEVVRQRLENVIEILQHHLQWVDHTEESSIRNVVWWKNI